MGPTGLLLAGPSSSGKTSLARTLQAALPDLWVFLLRTDGAAPPDLAEQVAAWLRSSPAPKVCGAAAQ